MVMKPSIEEMFPIWPDEPEDPQRVSLITDIHAGRFVKSFWEVEGNAEVKGKEKKKKMKGGVSSEAEPPTKKQKKVKTQNEAAATGKGSSEEEGSKDLENNATLTAIASRLENVCQKFDKIDSWFHAYELDRNRPLMDKKIIDARVKALLEERLKELGVDKIPENNDKLSDAEENKYLSFASPPPQQNKQQKLQKQRRQRLR